MFRLVTHVRSQEYISSEIKRSYCHLPARIGNLISDIKEFFCCTKFRKNKQGDELSESNLSLREVTKHNTILNQKRTSFSNLLPGSGIHLLLSNYDSFPSTCSLFGLEKGDRIFDIESSSSDMGNISISKMGLSGNCALDNYTQQKGVARRQSHSSFTPFSSSTLLMMARFDERFPGHTFF